MRDLSRRLNQLEQRNGSQLRILVELEGKDQIMDICKYEQAPAAARFVRIMSGCQLSEVDRVLSRLLDGSCVYD